MKKTLTLILALLLIGLAAAPQGAAAEGPVVNTVILKEADESMKNTYAVLAVNDQAPFVTCRMK